MTILTVGGLGFRNHYKTLEDAITNARTGDTIKLKNDQNLSGVLVTSNRLTIDADNHTIKVIDNQSGLNIDGLMLTIENATVELGLRNNIVAFNGVRENHLTLKNTSVVYRRNAAGKLLGSKVDPRDWFSPIATGQNAKSRLTLSNVKLPYINGAFMSIIASQSTIGHFFGRESGLKALVCDINTSTISNTQFFGDVSGETEPKLTLERVQTDGSIDCYDLTGRIAHLVHNLPDLPGRQFEKAFVDESFKGENDYALIRLDACDMTVEDITIVDNRTNPVSDYTYEVQPMALANTTAILRDTYNLTTHKPDTERSLLMSTAVESNLTIEDKTSAAYIESTGSNVSSPTEVATGQSSAYKQLQELIGLSSVKDQLNTFLATASLNAKRKEAGVAEATVTYRNMLFSGSPGTGKTTVAKLTTQILHEEGVIKTANTVIASVKDMTGVHVGETKQKTHALIESALDGVLFIDEAYRLIPNGQTNFELEALDQLLEDTSTYKDRLIVILAGYTDKLQELLQLNEGLTRRFPLDIAFPDYTEEELLDILELQLRKANVDMTQDTFDKLEALMRKVIRTSGGHLQGNAGDIENVINFLIGIRDVRITNELKAGRMLTPDQYNTATDADIDALAEKLM